MEKEISLSTKPGSKSSTSPEDSTNQSGSSDPVLAYLKKNNVPLTRENYLDLAYLGDPPEELDAEAEALLPEEIREKVMTPPNVED